MGNLHFFPKFVFLIVLCCILNPGLGESQEGNEIPLTLEEFLHSLARLKASPTAMSLFRSQGMSGNELTMEEFLDILVHQKQPVPPLSVATSAPLPQFANDQQDLSEYLSESSGTKRILRHVLPNGQTPATTDYSKAENRSQVVKDSKHGTPKEQIDTCEVNIYDIIYCIAIVSILFGYLYITNVLNALVDKVAWFFKDSLTPVPNLNDKNTTRV